MVVMHDHLADLIVPDVVRRMHREAPGVAARGAAVAESFFDETGAAAIDRFLYIVLDSTTFLASIAARCSPILSRS